MNRVSVVQGDITQLDVGAIVNAANEGMLGGGGVDGSIHRAAGLELLEACRALPEVRSGVRCPTGESRITPGFQLPALYVIHTVGPIWHGGKAGEPTLLANCYSSALELACEHEVGSVAFPAISCGVFGYPVAQAASVAHRALSEFLATDKTLDRVFMVAFGPDMLAALEVAFPTHGARPDGGCFCS